VEGDHRLTLQPNGPNTMKLSSYAGYVRVLIHY
jgi:hypothetical protein